jgi:hypothetical protein
LTENKKNIGKNCKICYTNRIKIVKILSLIRKENGKMKKIEFLMLTFIMFMMIGITNVNAADLEAVADEVAPNDTISFSAIAPTEPMEMDFYTNGYFVKLNEDYNDDNVNVGLNNCNGTYTVCELRVVEQGIEDPIPIGEETRSVNVVWQPTNSSIKTKVNTYINTLLDIQGMGEWGPNNYYFDITDMSLINYYVSANTKELDDNVVNRTISYSETLRNMFGGVNMTYAIDFRAGTSYLPFSSSAFGGLLFNYEGVVYGFADKAGIKFIEAIYVPSDTVLSDATLIAAANNRIEEYLPNSNITITAGDALDTFLNEVGGPLDFSELIDTTKTTDRSYLVNFGSFSVPFVIVADSSKMINPEFATNDINTDVNISSAITTIPLDTVVSVDELDEEGEEYQRLLALIGTDKMISYNLTLFSKTKNNNIIKLDNGKFLVNIPVPSELEGKTLIVYYVNAKNEKEAHDVTVKDGYASFETDHFSIYSLTEKIAGEENPQTYDGITTYFILVMISLIGLLGAGWYFKKFNL